jgi:serine/threonine protein kinase
MMMPADEKIRLNPAYDMWILGVLVYEVLTGEPYWKDLKNLQVLQIMADPRRPLPHEERPVAPMFQKILARLLHRNPLQRMSSADTIKRLELEATLINGGNTLNAGTILQQDDIILEN